MLRHLLLLLRTFMVGLLLCVCLSAYTYYPVEKYTGVVATRGVSARRCMLGNDRM